jgi:predicted phage replisome organizer
MTENKRFYWLRLKEDFFKSKEMKKIRTIAGGETFTIIYLKLQLLTLQTEGKFYFEHVDETLPKELSLIIDETPENIEITLNYLFSKGLLEVNGDEYVLPYVLECIGSETRSAERVRRHRENKEKERKMLQCNTAVTTCNTEKEREREKEKYKKENNQRKSSLVFDIFEYWKSVHNHQQAKLDNKRKRLIKLALSNYSPEDLKKAIDGCKKSDFHMGKNKNNMIYDQIELILRDSHHIELFIRLSQKQTLDEKLGFTPQDEEEYNAYFNS